MSWNKIWSVIEWNKESLSLIIEDLNCLIRWCLKEMCWLRDLRRNWNNKRSTDCGRWQGNNTLSQTDILFKINDGNIFKVLHRIKKFNDCSVCFNRSPVPRNVLASSIEVWGRPLLIRYCSGAMSRSRMSEHEFYQPKFFYSSDFATTLQEQRKTSSSRN